MLGHRDLEHSRPINAHLALKLLEGGEWIFFDHGKEVTDVAHDEALVGFKAGMFLRRVARQVWIRGSRQLWDPSEGEPRRPGALGIGRGAEVDLTGGSSRATPVIVDLDGRPVDRHPLMGWVELGMETHAHLCRAIGHQDARAIRVESVFPMPLLIQRLKRCFQFFIRGPQCGHRKSAQEATSASRSVIAIAEKQDVLAHQVSGRARDRLGAVGERPRTPMPLNGRLGGVVDLDQ